MQRIFGFNMTTHKKNNKGKYETYLSDSGRKNLKKYLKKDYECIEKLRQMDYLTNNQYTTLIK